MKRDRGTRQRAAFDAAFDVARKRDENPVEILRQSAEARGFTAGFTAGFDAAIKMVREWHQGKAHFYDSVASTTYRKAHQDSWLEICTFRPTPPSDTAEGGV